MRFLGMNSGDQRGKGSGSLALPEPGTFGAPSAWLFLIRLHACRAGLRFTRHQKYRACCGQGQTTRLGSETTVLSRRGLVRATEINGGCIFGSPFIRRVVPVPGFTDRL
jgi:hypothetical protein